MDLNTGILIVGLLYQCTDHHTEGGGTPNRDLYVYWNLNFGIIIQEEDGYKIWDPNTGILTLGSACIQEEVGYQTRDPHTDISILGSQYWFFFNYFFFKRP